MSNAKSVEILVIDDNEKNRLSLRGIIKNYFDNIQVIEADSGINALKILMRKTVDLIILDIQMPDMDGFEAAKIIQSRPKSRHIPIIFLTAAYKSEEFQAKGYKAGAVDYLTKPITPAQLASKIELYLRFFVK